MKKSFLDSLKGLAVAEAKARVQGAGYKSWVLPSNAIITAIARPDTVMIYTEDGDNVVAASAGDPVQVTND